MSTQRVMFTFPPDLIKEPIIWTLGREFNVITNIRRADVTENKGWVVLELEGAEEDIKRSLAWVAEKGVKVDAAIGDVVEG